MKLLESPTIYDTIPGKSTFTYCGHSYRLDGYLLMYTLSDGRILSAFTNLEEANGVHGYGLCGCIAYFDDIEICAETTSWNQKTVADHMDSVRRMIQLPSNQQQLSWIKSLMQLKPNGTMSPLTLERLQLNSFLVSLGMSPHTPVPFKRVL